MYKRISIIFYLGFIYIECYTDDCKFYIVNVYEYKFLRTTKKTYIFNRLDINYYIEEHIKEKYNVLNIKLEIIKINNKKYTLTMKNDEKINKFLELTNTEPPPPYTKKDLINYDDIY